MLDEASHRASQLIAFSVSRRTFVCVNALTLRCLLVAFAALLAWSWPRDAQANSAPKDWTTAAKSSGIARAEPVASLRVERIAIELDFRFDERAPSKAVYRVRNLESVPWEGTISFIASAGDVKIDVAGHPTAISHEAPLTVSRNSENDELPMLVPRGPGYQEAETYDVSSFHASIPAGSTLEFSVRFRAEPGVTTHREDSSGGLYRLGAAQWEGRDEFFTYPLWPAIGFGGGIGPMQIRVRCDEGSRPEDAPGVAFHFVNGMWETTVPEAQKASELALSDVHVARVKKPRPRFGVTLFPAFRAGTSPDHIAFNLRTTVDMTTFRSGAVMAGAETDFNRTVNATLSYQYGTATVYGSAYATAGFILAIKPQISPGVEVGAGLRMFFLPLDFAFQFHPVSLEGTREVAFFRALIGLKIGFFGL